MPADDRFRKIIKGSVEPPEPSPAQRERARTALHEAYLVEERPQRRSRWRPSIGWATAAAAGIAIVVAVLATPGSTPPLDANLENIARVARTLDTAELPEGSYVYSHMESTVLISSSLGETGPEIFYLLPTSVDIWRLGTTEERRVTVHYPSFFDETSEDAYYAVGEDLGDRVGETYTEALGNIPNQENAASWPTDVDALRDQLELEDESRTVEEIQQLLDPTLNAPPALRAALIEVLGGLDVTTEMIGDVVRVTLRAHEPGLGLVLRELDLDSAGFMTRAAITVLEPATQFLVPAGTVISLETFSRPFIVDGPGVLPG
ncbi:MAG: hypothetical protein GY720_09870 [bacterium]|nr:hypothetical protein [bacterium]